MPDVHLRSVEPLTAIVAVRVTPRNAVDQFIDIGPAHQFALLLHQPQLQHLGLDLDVISVSLTARRLPPLAPQVSEVSNAALLEREAVTLPLDHAFGFELTDVGPAANRGAALMPTR
jgi:hypothetical protein